MRIVIVSDTHGRADLLTEAMRQAGRTDLLVHLGDGVRDCDALEPPYGGEILQVRGNCDIASLEPADRLVPLDGGTLYLCHGHLLDAKHTLYRLWTRGREVEAALVCFGHTHQPLLDRQGELILLNPGSLRYSGTFALLDTGKTPWGIEMRQLFPG